MLILLKEISTDLTLLFYFLFSNLILQIFIFILLFHIYFKLLLEYFIFIFKIPPLQKKKIHIQISKS